MHNILIDNSEEIAFFKYRSMCFYISSMHRLYADCNSSKTSLTNLKTESGTHEASVFFFLYSKN